MKLVILTDNFLPRHDGIVSFLKEIIPRLKDSFDITVIAPGNDTEINGVAVKGVALSKKTIGDFTLPRFRPFKLWAVVRNADIVFSQTIGPIGGLGLFIAQRLGKKTISFIHSVEWELFPKSLENNFFKKYAYPLTKKFTRFLYASCTQLIVPSERIADMLLWQKINTPKKIIHLGVDTNCFTPGKNDALRKELGIESNNIVIGYHGRLSRDKDILTLLRAFIKLKKKHSNITLLVVGDGIPFIINRFKKAKHVVYVPGVDHVEKYLQVMDIYCLPSLTETTSLSTLEAMSCALPVVTTSVGFIKDYVKHGGNGFFFMKGDSFSLVTELELLITNKSLRSKLGENGRKTVQTHFNWDETATKLSEFFQQVIK